jgi:hypothetical protein
MKSHAFLIWPISVLALASALLTVAAPVGPPERLRQDWYFRETLPAIRDWETILARWEQATPEAERTPRFPVPTNGQAVLWPNPIPPLLRPPWDMGQAEPVRNPASATGVPSAVRAQFTAGRKLVVEREMGPGAVERKTHAPGETVTGYKHPGGGGHDHWYHGYGRRFDRLTTFQPQPAPFVLGFDNALDFGLGANELSFALRNTSPAPLSLRLRLRLLTPQGDHECADQALELAGGTSQTARLPFELKAPGGGLLLLRLESANQSWWLPFFTHVEDVPAVLRSVGQILDDAPDGAATARLEKLRRTMQDLLQSVGQASHLSPNSPPTENRERSQADGRDARPTALLPRPSNLGRPWRALFEKASALREERLLARLSFDSLLFLKRQPYFSEQPFMDAHHLFNRPGGGIYRLSPVRPDGQVTPVVDGLGEGVYRDLCLDWDAQRFLFSFGNGCDAWDGKQSYHVYARRLDGGETRQLTFGPKNDCEPFHLPNGQIGFTSDRSEHFVMCGGDRHVANLFVMEPDGSNPRQLSFNLFNDFNPSVLPDGRIIYSRWEYNERSVTSLHKLFTINPDGTMMAPYYGNATFRPNVIMFPRAVPRSQKVMALLTAHHGQTHGPIALVDVARGMDGSPPLTLLTPGVPVTGEKIEDSRQGWFSDPWPLSEDTYLCSFTPTVLPWLARSWALYVGDRHGNLALVYRDAGISCAEPVPLMARARPPVMVAAAAGSAATNTEAVVILQDVYAGLPGVPRGEVKFLRVLEDLPRKGVHQGGVVVTAATSIYTVKRVLGVVPVDADGSAHFIVPANRNVYFEALDAQQREVQRMRSVVCLKPDETRTCVGCHESRLTAPPNLAFGSPARPPQRPIPPLWGELTLSFLRDVQPLLNARCVSCHAFDRSANGVILTGDLTDQFNIAYQELLPFVRTANAMRWDHPDDVLPRPPYTYGSKVSTLTKLLEAGHHDVKLSDAEWQVLFHWMDANAVYYDRYQSAYGDRHIFGTGVRREMENVHGRRCASCHGGDDGRGGSWWLSINRRDPKLSRALLAPLARAAGGWERCEGPVFVTTEDPDYRKLLAALSTLSEQLGRRPREDLLSLRGTEAEQQEVTLPTPPPRAAAAAGIENATNADWVCLSDVRWESGRAGWTPNHDGLPRRDKDVEGHPLRLGGRSYRKGLGTHAPSEIVYPLEGQYSRFTATVGGAEANGTVVFQVFADDKRVFDSGLLRGLGEVKKVDVAIAGARRLRLVVLDGGDGYNADMANWADPRLWKAVSPKTP